MKTTLVIAVTLAVAVSAGAEDRKFSAADAPAAKIRKQGKIVISNNRERITAFRFFGNIREALVNLRATRRITSRPFGNPNAALDVRVPAYLTAYINEAAQAHGVDPRLVAAVARRESAFNPRAVSHVGASGLMQLMPATAEFLGVSNVFDPQQNVNAGTRYLRTLLDTFNGDLDLALAAYNAGPGAVRRFNGVPPYRETKAYVAAVRASYEQALKN